MNKGVCSKCNHNLVVEYVGNYGTIYYLRKDGSEGHKIKSIKYEFSGNYFVYCPNCGESYDGRFIDGRFIPYVEE